MRSNQEVVRFRCFIDDDGWNPCYFVRVSVYCFSGIPMPGVEFEATSLICTQ